ncbi:hypothetical protein FHS19_002446 [Paenibacillus rhizosphaerae]|uniref:DNA-binding protein n=1 Tax=Paenibacillus rhizosphaerae TaxID=297318 RepID=A0A839TM96_9BACL|nr:DNA-binding protein [Paenibacillus rhizosphaerae]MBB3127792.1 hypothetical protein [Paenibacillus rhizosphaerae]
MEDRSMTVKIEIDTLVTMLKMAFSFENWDNMIKISTELYESAYEMYVEQKERNRRIQVTERPIVYYFGYSHLMKGLAYQKKKMYQEAKQCIANYEDLSYMSDGSPANNQAVENFRFFAKANMFTLNILSGNLDCLEDYSAFIQENPSETLPGLITILEAANIHNYDVDHILDILVVEDSQLIPIDQNPVDLSYYISFLYLLAVYRFKKENHVEALDRTLQALTLSDKLEDDKIFKKCVALFESFRSHASLTQLESYSSIQKNILKGAIEDEEGIVFDGSSIRTI